MSRKKSREYAFRLVFEKFFHEPELDVEFADDEFVVDDNDRDFVNELLTGVNSHYDEILGIVKENLVGYELERVYKIDLAILMIASYEILFCEDIPDKVSVNEAVEIAKIYSTDNSPSFINGVLAGVIRDKEELLNERNAD